MTERKLPVHGTLRSKMTGDGTWDVDFSLSNLGRNQKTTVEEILEGIIERFKKAEE